MRIGIVKVDHIGDAILTEPSIRALKIYKRAHITLIVTPYLKDLFQDYKYKDTIIILPSDRLTLSSFVRIRERLADMSFDEIYVFSPRSLGYIAGLIPRAKIRYSYVYTTRILAKFLYSRFYKLWIDPVDKYRPDTYRYGIQHEVLQNAQVLKLAGIYLNDSDLEIRLTVQDTALAKAERIWNNRKPRILVAVHKMLYVDGTLLKLREFLKPYAPIYTAGPHEPRQILAELADENLLYNLKLQELIALIATADLVISANTGPLHIASAFKRKLVAYYQNRGAYFETRRWAPWRTVSKIVVEREGEPVVNAKRIFESVEELLEA